MRRNGSTKISELRQRRDAPLRTPSDLTRSATKDIAGAMNAILADVFALYLKTKNFHWHMSGPHFRDDAPRGYAEFDQGVPKKFVIDPHDSLKEAVRQSRN